LTLEAPEDRDREKQPEPVNKQPEPVNKQPMNVLMQGIEINHPTDLEMIISFMVLVGIGTAF
jgi:hypothetical protein